MFYVLAWGITFGVIILISQALPSATVPAIIDPSKPRDSWTDLLTLVIPANFVADLSRNYVPAVVIFSILYGVAIQRSPSKAPFLEILDLIRSASVTLWEWVVKLAPFAIFALFAETAGTLALENLPSLLLYLVLFLVGTFILAFWILPSVIAALAPVSPKAVLTEIRSGLVIAVVTTLSVTALPFILEATRKLAAACEIDDQERDDIIRTTLSVTYPLGQLGNFFVYLFMLFAVYFFRTPLPGFEQVLLPLFTLLSCIGSPTSTVDAVTFLSSWLRLPDSSTQLGLIVRSSQAGRFLSQAAIAEIPNLRLAFFYDPFFAPLLHSAFPTAELTNILNYKELLSRNDIDAVIAAFSQASAFATAHPGHQCCSPSRLRSPLLFVYVMPPESDEFLHFVNSWLLLREADRFKRRMHDYWILGKQPARTQPRWSIMRDVLHWVK